MSNFNIEISSSNSDRVFLNKEFLSDEKDDTVRKHSFLASIFYRIFGSGIVTLKGSEGKKYYINKKSLINFCNRHGIKTLGKLDEGVVIKAVMTIIERSKSPNVHANQTQTVDSPSTKYRNLNGGIKSKFGPDVIRNILGLLPPKARKAVLTSDESMPHGYLVEPEKT